MMTHHHDHTTDAVEQTIRNAIRGSAAEGGALHTIEAFSEDAMEALCEALHEASDSMQGQGHTYVGTIADREDYSERRWTVRVMQPNA